MSRASDRARATRAPRRAPPEPAQILALRRAAGLSQTDAARLLCVSTTTWGRWERGAQRMGPALWLAFAMFLEGRRQAAEASANRGVRVRNALPRAHDYDHPLPLNDGLRERAARDAFERWVACLAASRFDQPSRGACR